MNDWKTIGIISISFNILLVILMFYFYNLGTTMIEDEELCSSIVCNVEGAVAYEYNDVTRICTCYSEDDILSVTDMSRWDDG